MKTMDSEVMKNAAQWFARVREGQLTESEDKAWSSWIGVDAHQHAYEAIELTWELTEDLRESSRVRGWLHEIDVKTTAARRGWTGFRALPLRWAASLTAASMIVVAVFLWWPEPSKEYSTVVGEQRTVILDDGSEVTLNTNTSVSIRYTRAARRVTLSRGEADFKVTKDAMRPFEVTAFQGFTRAVGTEFDVKLDAERATVTVMEGSVLVRADRQRDDGASATVDAGQAVDYTARGELSGTRAAVAAKIRAWQAHHWVFNDETLADALRDYNRYVETPIEVHDPALATRRINGVFRIGDSEAFLNAVEQSLKVKATRTAEGIVLEPR